MAVGFDMFEKKLDRKLERLEKFFSKKKRADVRDSIVAGSRPSTPLPLYTKSEPGFQAFPQPSYLKPTSTRMVARDEVVFTPKSGRRTQSLPESSPTPNRMSLTPSTHETQPSPTSKLLDQFPRIPNRSSSLGPRHGTASLAELLEFSFTDRPRNSEDSSVSPRSRSGSIAKSSTRASSVSVSPKARISRRQLDGLQDSRSAVHQNGLDTPPPSAGKNQSFALMQPDYQKRLPIVVPRPNLTPEPSPRLIPLAEPTLNRLQLDHMPGSERPKSLDTAPDAPREILTALHKSISDTTLSSLSTPPNPAPVLKEPSFSDFLSLSDDDIADGHPVTTPGDSHAQPSALTNPPSCSLPPDPPVFLSSLQASNGERLLTLPPPLATRPVAAAAYEAARIAARYKFDLVYVVNLWPSHLGCSQHRPVSKQSSTSSLSACATLVTPSTPVSSQRTGVTLDQFVDGQVPVVCDNRRIGLTGRLLAAYGLPSLSSPFRVSAPVHRKVLRAEGWLEFRARPGENERFSRGYSCSFYAGYSPDERWQPGSADNESGSGLEAKSKRYQERKANRGIVFAAYRKPRPDGTELSTGPEELDALREDAETLVNMLIDIYMTHRQKRLAALQGCISGETGPLPTPPTPAFAF
ncbi:hypothetical protein QBC46DRAFT_109802 [Diplogelasinospora grovesii]|uniref:Uncharacterized protein n=1 Tax=Diplogelasinospora grovesii TaxID=303347 RepID=A0AAN6N8G0_9PEZI|nr:hypothetical protein QBC46DRAFT_109802 [Diplogelasinospora grovesii]